MNNVLNTENLSQDNYPDGGFLQSEEWRKFQESVGRKTFHVELKSPSSPPFKKGEDICFWANIIEHQLPVVGKYFYIPRGPVIPAPRPANGEAPQMRGRGKAGIQKNLLDSGSEAGMTQLIDLAKKEKAGWIRIEPENDEVLEIISKVEPFSAQGSTLKIRKAPHDMQPKEIFVMDIMKSEKELLAEMKQKTRYNIRLAEKKGVTINVIPAKAGIQKDLLDSGSVAGMTDYIKEFIRLVKITAKRDKITPHPESYYRKMFETIPSDILKLYVAEYNNEIIAANLMIFYGKTATYLHGASDNNRRNLMAPYLLQWQAILDAKAADCEKYDLGGIHTKTGKGITKFKLGFAPNTIPVEFPGSYDIVLNLTKYYLYKVIQKMKSIL